MARLNLGAASKQLQYKKLQLLNYVSRLKRRRAWRFKISFNRYIKFEIVFRRFKSNKLRQSIYKKQLVLPFYYFGLRELAVEWRPRTWKFPLLTPGWANATIALLIATGIAGSIYFGTHLHTAVNLEPTAKVLAVSPAPQKTIAKPVVAAPKVMPASQPTEVDIPSVNISAPIIPTYLRSDGAIQVPDSSDEAGWYDKSPTPGELGPSIIVGHVDYLTGIAVFWRLRNVQAGDEIDITRADGSVARFKVNSVGDYSQDNFPTDEVYGNINEAGLRLITCSGVFDSTTRHYSDNLVVYGSLM